MGSSRTKWLLVLFAIATLSSWETCALVQGDASAASLPLSYYDDLRISIASSTNSTSSVALKPLTHDVFEIVPAVTRPASGVAVEASPQPEYLRHLSAIIAIHISPVVDSYNDIGALLLAVHHFNNRIATVVPDLAHVSSKCNLKFTIDFYDTEYSVIRSARYLIQDILARKKIDPPEVTRPYPSALIGGTRSAVSAPLATLAGVHGLTQVSAHSTSTSLDNTGQYPTFGRTIASAVGDANAAVDYLSEVLGVTHLAVLFVKDAYGSTYAQAVKEFAGLLPEPMEVTLYAIEFDASDEDISYQISQIKNSRKLYVLGIIFITQLDAILGEAKRQGIAGPDSGHFWIFGDAIGGVVDTAEPL